MEKPLQNIVKIHNNWPDDTFQIDINLGNYCNYKCWYCWPGSNAGTHKFPDVEILKNNIRHLIKYIKANSNKKKFDVHFCGGEPSHWPKLIEFVKFLKEEFNCLTSMTTNGSKKIDWWQEAAPYFDRIHLSCHHEYVDIEHFRNVADYLFEKNVIPTVGIMMDPHAWDKCIELSNYLKGSKHRWTIRCIEIIDNDIEYTEEQKRIISKYRVRQINPFWFLWHNKYYVSKVRVTDESGKVYRMKDNEILLTKLNNFYGWECSIGFNWININMKGEMGGNCNQIPYNELTRYNFYKEDFPSKFNPVLSSTICEQLVCKCNSEVNMPKEKISNKKVIPIYAN